MVILFFENYYVFPLLYPHSIILIVCNKGVNKSLKFYKTKIWYCNQDRLK